MPSTPEVALTGATGFIGSAILNCLVAGRCQVRALHRPRRGRVPPRMAGVKWIVGDLKEAAPMRELVAGADAVVHCAGAVRGATRAAFDAINVDATRRLAEAAAQQGRMPRFLLISSLAAREPGLSHYAASKRGGEMVLEQAGSALPWTVVRPPAVYGPGDRELLPLFRAMASGLAPLPANAAGRISLLHVDDLARAVSCWLAAEVPPRSTFELDDGWPTGYDWPTIIDIARRVLRPAGRIRPVQIPLIGLRLFAHLNQLAAMTLDYPPMLTPGKVRELTHPDWVCRQGQFATLTGWQARTNFEQGLAGLFPSRPPAARVP